MMRVPADFVFLDLVGLGGIEPPTSRLSGVRSNRLSYSPREARGNEPDRPLAPMGRPDLNNRITRVKCVNLQG